MEKTNVVGKKKGWSIWATTAFILFWLIGLTFWVQYEGTQGEEKEMEKAVAGKPILHISKQTADDVCECPKPKAKFSRKKSEPRQKPAQQTKSKPVFKTEEVLAGLATTQKLVANTTQKVELKTVLDTVDPDYGKTEVVFTPLPEKEVQPPRVGRKILVIRQRPMMQYYGGYRSDYYQPYTYSPRVTYGQPYIPSPQTVFVPAPPVIVHAPSVVTPAPSVVTPSGGYKPRGTTDGHSPLGRTDTAL